MRVQFLIYCFFILTLIPGAGTGLAADESAGQTQARFNLKQGEHGEAPQKSIFELTFGSIPEMATERGILVIDAFFDEDGDMEHGPDEDTLHGQIQCQIDEIDYSVPAFIPGLDYQETYELDCRGKRYQPQVNEDLVFIRKRGQIVQIDLPCRLHTAEEKLSQNDKSVSSTTAGRN